MRFRRASGGVSKLIPRLGEYPPFLERWCLLIGVALLTVGTGDDGELGIRRCRALPYPASGLPCSS